VKVVHHILASPEIEILSHTHGTFLAGFALYEARPDKAYSLTDCVSMNLMRERGINDVLTHDNHFAVEGPRTASNGIDSRAAAVLLSPTSRSFAAASLGGNLPSTGRSSNHLDALIRSTSLRLYVLFNHCNQLSRFLYLFRSAVSVGFKD
jgi:hypothetical protein